MIRNCAAMLQNILQERLAPSIDEQYDLHDDVGDKDGYHVFRVDEHSRIRVQILKYFLGDSSDTKALVLSRDPVSVQWLGGNPETIFDQVTVTDWLR